MRLSEIDSRNISNELIKKMFFSMSKRDYNYADYVIVYGCHIKKLLNERLEYTLSLIKKKKYGKLVLTGGVGVHGDFNESEYMYNFLVQHGVNGDKIIVENKSTTTEENNINVLNILNFNSIEKKINVVLVSQELHMLRLMLHWKKIIDNPNINFYCDYVEKSFITYETAINNPEILELLQKQVEKTIELVKEGKYVDIDIDDIL